MVRRLLVVLLSISCGLWACAHSNCDAQDDAPKTKIPAKVIPAKVIPAKAEPAKADPAQQDSAQQDPAKQDPAKVMPGKVIPAKVPPTTDASNKDMPPKKDVIPIESDSPPKPKPQEVEIEPVLRSEMLLPASTKFWLSIPDADELEKQFDSTQFGLLAKDPAIKPFIDSLRDQAKEILNDQNVRLGLEVDDLKGVHSGEICIAGVLPELDGQQQVKGSHGLVLLVNIAGNETQAEALQGKINAELIKRGAKQERKMINGVEIIKSTVNQQKPFRNSQSNFQVILNGKFLVCDNETIFRDVLRRLAAPGKIQKVETLADHPSFVSIMKKTRFEDYPSHIRWFVDPFGYIQLAQALENEDRGNRQPTDDWAKILKDQGFNAFQGIGGNISIATGEHEILHRTFTYAPQDLQIKNGKRVFELFDFNGNPETLEPASWVPTNSSAYVVGNWNFSKALQSAGDLYDAFLEEDGAFKRTLNDFKVDPDMQLDIEKLVGLLNNRMTMISAVEHPITESSERVVLGFPITGEPEFVFGSLRRATRGQVLNLGGIDVIEVDSAAMDDEADDGTFRLPGEEPLEEEEPAKRTFQLFAKRYFVVHDGYLLVANNKDYLKKILVQKASKLSQSPDYIQIKEAIGKLTSEENVRWRQFGRMDRTLEANYEMLRRGEMGKSQTVLARLVNQIFAKDAEEKAAAEGKEIDKDAVRIQKLDGSKLPKNYAKSVAPYLGPMGWVMETDKDGWRITGCVIKKKGMTEVVQKTGDESTDSQQR